MNTIKKTIILLLCFILLTGFMTSNEVTNEDLFIELQNNITESMTVRDGKYIYDEEVISSLINLSDVKFENINFTKEDFIEIAIKNIQETDLTENYLTRGIYCNSNFNAGGWNYTRAFASKSVTEGDIADLTYAANNWGLVAAGAGSATMFTGPVGAAFFAGFALGAGWNSWYASTLANSLTVKNNGRCGTVTDINKYTTVFTVWSQEEF